jgi:hypothetical protein
MILGPMYGHISYSCCLSNAFKLKHRHYPATIIPASWVEASCVQLLIIIHRIWKVLKVVEDRMERKMVGKTMILISS